MIGIHFLAFTECQKENMLSKITALEIQQCFLSYFKVHMRFLGVIIAVTDFVCVFEDCWHSFKKCGGKTKNLI